MVLLGTVFSSLGSVLLSGETHSRASMHFAVKILNTTRESVCVMFTTFRLYRYRGGVSMQAFLLLGATEKVGDRTPVAIASYVIASCLL